MTKRSAKIVLLMLITLLGWVQSAGAVPVYVVKVGTGSEFGTVTGINPVNPGDPINCGTDCSTDLAPGSGMILQAVPGANAFFAGWQVTGGGGSNFCSALQPTCHITMDTNDNNQPITVTARFDLGFILTVVKEGTGTGNILSNALTVPENNCSATQTLCTQTYPQDEQVTLTAVASNNSRFVSWGGACSGTAPTCTVMMSQARVVTARFDSTASIAVSLGGAGGGTVTSNLAGISCSATGGSNCAANFTTGTSVTLTATADVGSRFAGWAGACAFRGTQPTCTLTSTTQPQTVTANFELAVGALHFLTVGNIGTGQGRIISQPAGIDCAVACDARFPADSQVTLSAIPASGSVFMGWQGDGNTPPCGTALTCTVTMSEARLVSATFNRATSLTVVHRGSGQGITTSTPDGIACDVGGSSCSADFVTGRAVEFKAEALAGSRFSGWGGACANSGTSPTCLITTTATPQTIEVNYELSGGTTRMLAITKQGPGNGTIMAFPTGITCGADCSENYPLGSVVTLVAIIDKDAQFAGWGGDVDASCGTALVCQVLMDKARAVTATFSGFAAANSLTVIKDGSGSEFGRVLSTPAGIDCGASNGNRVCANNFASGQSVTLVASIPDANSGTAFAGWEVYFGNIRQTNMCSGIEPTCQITMTGDAMTVRARFERGYILTLQNHGNGQGSIIANAGNLQEICFDTLCSQTYNFNQVVTLTANPASGSAFRGWQGACTGFEPTCNVTMNQARLVTAVFDRTISGQLSMMVIKEGSGSAEGRVVAVPEGGGDGIDCASNNSRDCSGLFQAGRGVTLTASVPNPNTGAYFSRWQIYYWDPVDLKWVLQPDMCTGLEPVCHVTMASEVQARVMFDIGFILTVVRDGTGQGSIVTNVPELDNCTVNSDKTICSQTFNSNRRVTLIALASLESRFIGWNSCGITEDRNGDGVNETCIVTMSDAKLVTATFDKIDSARLTVLKDTRNTGSGVIKSEPLGIDCGELCIRNFAFDTKVKLTAIPAEGSEFVGWGGDWCAGTELVCEVTMDKAKIVMARFDLGFRLTVDKQGSGAGRITSQPQGIDCGATCVFNFTNNATVTLTVKPDEGSTFLGWGGACSASGTALSCTLPMTESRKVIATFSDRVLGKALDNQQLNWLSGGDAAWFAQSDVYYFGDASVRSGRISHGQQSWIQTTLIGPGRLTFHWAVSSEAERDVLRFEASYGAAAQISGDVDWQQRSYDVPAGTHTVRWTYLKDGDLNRGLDFALLDHVIYQSGTLLTISQLGNGFGSVVSNPRGLDCQDSCIAGFERDTLVTLAANPLEGSTFAGWGGACHGTAPTCSVTLNESKQVTVRFDWAALLPTQWASPLGRLNDTGIDWCANNANNYLSNNDAWCKDLAISHPNQDGHVGRDAAVRQGSINKIGGGSAGFDYTRICNSGEVAGQGQCPPQPQLGTGPNDWGCTRDNVTGLIWEVKTVGGLRDKDRVYSWFNADDRTNGGNKGDDCLAEQCNTARYVDSINRLGLCGASDWRLPTRQELHSLVHHGRTQPAVDSAYFPNTPAQPFWTSTPTSHFANAAWYVHFDAGWDYWDNKANKQRIRLVRSCSDCRNTPQFGSPMLGNDVLYLPVLNIDGRFYEARLRVVNNDPLTLELIHTNEITAQIGRFNETMNAWPRYYPGKNLMTIGQIAVGAERYNAAFQQIPNRQPLRFVLSAARKIQ